MLGTPYVEKNGERIFFSLAKAEALFYYIVVKQKTTREELTNLLWGNVNEEKAKKSLRNSIYNIRRLFEANIIISPQRSILLLNPDLEIKTDVDEFLTADVEMEEAYKGEFLMGLFVKNEETYENWLLQEREYYNNLRSKKLYQAIKQKHKNVAQKYSTEQYAKWLINADEFDEEAYRILMKHYAQNKQYSKAISTYKQLMHTLQKELGIQPDEETKQIHNSIVRGRISQRIVMKNEQASFFYGRKKELDKLKNGLFNFYESKTTKSIIVLGEAGVGKTRLVEECIKEIQNQDVYFFKSDCYQTEENYSLKPWNPIFTKLADIVKQEKIEIPIVWEAVILRVFPNFSLGRGKMENYNIVMNNSVADGAIQEAIVGLLSIIAKTKKIVFVFEDLHWMDAMSLDILKSLLLRQKQHDIILLATCREGYDEKTNHFFAALVKYNLTEKLHLARFTKIESDQFIKKALPSIKVSSIQLDRIYDDTEGNTFFLAEYVNTVKEKGTLEQISTKGQEILGSRLVDISDEARKMLNIISLFFHKVSLHLLKCLSGKDDFQMLELLEELLRKCLIRETNKDGKISFEFTHNKMREFVYTEQSETRRKLLHQKIGHLLEGELTNSSTDLFTRN